MKVRSKNAIGKNRFFDLRMGGAGSIVMGVVVYYVNHEHGFSLAIVASLKQAFYTFFIGSLLSKLCENLSISFENKLLAVAMAVFTTTALSAILTFILHSIKGTPETINSTLVTIALAAPGFLWWSLKQRRKLDNQQL